MKSATTSKKPRYKQVLEEREKARRLLMNLMGLCDAGYFEAELTCGLRLIEHYFEPFQDAERVKKQVAEDKRIGFWPFFRNLRADYELRFWHFYRLVYEDDRMIYGPQRAGELLGKEWRQAMRELVHDDLIHQRLHQFLIQHGELIK